MVAFPSGLAVSPSQPLRHVHAEHMDNRFTFISFSTVKRLRESCHQRILHMDAGFFDKWSLGEMLLLLPQ